MAAAAPPMVVDTAPPVTVVTAPPVTVGTLASPVTVSSLAPSVPSAVASLLNSTLLSATLLSFGCQRYTPRTKSDFGDVYDYIVVGAGSAGSVVASRLSEMSCVTVLLLEAGTTPPWTTEVPGLASLIFHTPFDWDYRTVPQKNSALALVKQEVQWPSGKMVGGTSCMNAMFYVRGNMQNFNNWSMPGWSYNDVKPYFIRAEDNQNPSFYRNGYHGRGGPLSVSRPRYKPEIKGPFMEGVAGLGYKVVDSNAARQTGFFEFQSTMRCGQRCSTGKAYLVPVENRTNLDIIQKARVTKVVIENKRATGVLVEYMGQTRFVLAREEVIVSAGAIQTPQLLMQSGIGPKEELEKHGIPVVAYLPVGKNLQDHVVSYIFFEITNKTVQPWTVKIATGLNEYIENRTGPLASAEFIFITAFLKNDEINPIEDFPTYQNFYGEDTVEILLDLGVKEEVYAKTFSPYAGRPMLMCSASQMQPKSRGTVTLKSSDPYDAPNIDPNYFDDPQDVKDVVAGLKNCIQMATTPPMKNFGVQPLATVLLGCEQYLRDELEQSSISNEYLACYARHMTFTTCHKSGTCKMGDPNDATTVVDSQLRVHGIESLRVIDASIMPNVTFGNTNAPTIMIAEKASDMIKSKISCDC